MSEEYLRAQLGWLGPRGYSAYEVAVQNGFKGTEKDWLAQLGTSSHFSEDKKVIVATAEQNSFDIPESYVTGSLIDVYVEGRKLTTEEYIVAEKINLVGFSLDEGAVVEIVIKTMSTNDLPITETINESSTNETAAGTKSVYDYFKQFINTIYPVGSIYMNTNETSPEVLFGGTWERIQDRFLLGAGSTYAAGSTGGEAAHKLEVYELPNHRHNIANCNELGADLDFTPVLVGDVNKGWEGAAFTSYEGGGEPHNNMPPYLTVYMWKRIS